MLAGRQTLDGAWRAQVRSDIAHNDKQHSLEILWDVKKCYENVRHADLVDQGRKQGYPMALLRVSIASYCWGRHVILDHQVMSPPVYPTRGIIAGSSHATFEIAMLVQGELGLILDTGPKCGLSIHVDDLYITMNRSCTSELIQDAIKVASLAKESVEVNLNLPIADTKSQVITSSPEMDLLVAKVLGNQLGEIVVTARRLGVDHTLRNRVVKVGRPVFKARRLKHLGRFKLAKKLAGKGLKAGPKSSTRGCCQASCLGQSATLLTMAHSSWPGNSVWKPMASHRQGFPTSSLSWHSPPNQTRCSRHWRRA
jgi:hypothetical protein